jgi:hypothetical protein
MKTKWAIMHGGLNVSFLAVEFTGVSHVLEIYGLFEHCLINNKHEKNMRK